MAVYFEHNFPTWKTMVMGAFLGLSVASCADNDYDWERAREENFDYQYEKNFKAIFGEIDPNQSWDFSYYGTGYETMTRATRAALPNATIATGNGCATNDGCSGYDSEGYYNVQAATITWLNNNLKEGDHANKGKGTPFSMKMPDNSFTIIPIYQGGASYTWTLKIIQVAPDGTETVQSIWSKNQNVQYKESSTDSWHNLADSRNSQINKHYQKSGTKYYRNGTIDAYAVRTKPYTISGIPAQTEIYFMLDVQGHDNTKSTEGQMALLQCPRPSNISANHDVLIMGCEDIPFSVKGCDEDMNDVVFMIIGNKKTPKEYKITEKRYMAEDLGSTDDFDFNDIVVDVKETMSCCGYNTDGTPKYDRTNSNTEVKQTATIRAMGGTLDFELYFGNTLVFKKSNPTVAGGIVNSKYNPTRYNNSFSASNIETGTMYNTGREKDGDNYKITNDYIATIDLGTTALNNPWRPENNNIKFKVFGAKGLSGDNNGNTVYEIYFPANGTVPEIIALKPNAVWQTERQTITPEWFNQNKR